MQISLRNSLGMMNNRTTDGPMDDLAIMKETLRVKDEELQNLARDICARDSTIREIADKLSETAEAAASAAHTMDEQRRIACVEIERISNASQKQLELSLLKMKEAEEKVGVISKERDELMKQRDAALQEAYLWRSELAKARDRAVILEAAVVRAEEKVKGAELDAETRIKDAVQRESASIKEKEQLLAYVDALQAQIKRQHIDNKQALDKTREEGADKACVTDSGMNHEQAENVVHVSSPEWNDIQATESTAADVREVSTDTVGSSLDIPVVNNHLEQPRK